MGGVDRVYRAGRLASFDRLSRLLYGRCGEQDQREIVATVRPMLGMAISAVDINGEISFAIHTGKNTPHIGSVRRGKTRPVQRTTRLVALEPVYCRTNPYRTPHPMHTKRNSKTLP